ncbi:Rieske (2Fe-2S) protein [Alteraurantiacibacter buctensis]|uniref:Rieske 2Fe-2S domain-containing protein n=1 Tax=Alteraurantiacibacter buctensis TaxID=1503981 RepID=A0A844Z276_9SPHN|nr:Rieske 2Fe-2S domain-containing protein [Alteraurantiacibacter buctensis]MXO73260.1 Rieske 2Fe-2S domain-containing protein [Alteraurantiacibacter buctensis]
MHDWQNLPNAPAPGTTLGLLAEVGDGGREFVFGQGLAAFRLFVIALPDGGVRAFVNRCPHYSLPLNVRPGQFLTRDGAHIMCRQHLALFDRESGVCRSGAAEGTTLPLVPVIVDAQGCIAIA